MNDYEKLDMLGAGGFGHAIKMRHKTTGAIVVAKQVATSALSESERKQAQKEAQVLASLQHANIVGYVNFYQDDHYLTILMEFVDDGDLMKKINDKKDAGTRFEEEQIWIWFVQILYGVGHVHEKNIVHRDLKPDNIFINKRGQVKIGDFGLATIMQTTTSHKTVVGTYPYSAPELFEGEKHTNKSDMWAVGVVLYYLAVLKLPFNAPSPMGFPFLIMKGEYEPLAVTWSSNMRQLVVEILQKAAKRPMCKDILDKAFLSTYAQKWKPIGRLAAAASGKVSGSDLPVFHSVRFTPPSAPPSSSDHKPAAAREEPISVKPERLGSEEIFVLSCQDDEAVATMVWDESSTKWDEVCLNYLMKGRSKELLVVSQSSVVARLGAEREVFLFDTLKRRTFRCQDIVKGEWTEISVRPVGRSLVQAVTMGRHIYLIGGSQDGSVSVCERFTSPDNLEKIADLKIPVQLPAVCGYENKIYAFGGLTQEGSSTYALQVYDGSSWRTKDDVLVEPDWWVSAAAIKGTVHLCLRAMLGKYEIKPGEFSKNRSWTGRIFSDSLAVFGGTKLVTAYKCSFAEIDPTEGKRTNYPDIPLTDKKARTFAFVMRRSV